MKKTNEAPVAAIAGVGPGLGAAVAKRFAQAYRTALLARKGNYLNDLASEIQSAGGQALAVPVDLSDGAAIEQAFATINDKIGAPRILVYNAAMRPGGRLMETSPEIFEKTWRVSVLGAFLCARETVPEMLARNRGVILFTGATAGVKPSPSSAAFGPAKFALKGLANVLARDLGPQGIHVAYINIDGVIDTPAVRKRFPGFKEEDMLKPPAIAETYWHLAHQDPSSWTLELDVRPFKEKF